MEKVLSPKAGGGYERLQLTPSLEKRLRDPSVVSGISSLSAAELGEGDGTNVLRPASTLETVKEGPRRQLKVMSIVGLCYFAVCGGPIGSEYIISAGGPLIGFIFLLLFPFIFGIPIAYVTAELSTTFPQDGGYTVWVLNALGPFWAFQTGYWAWVSGVIDNAIYPALAVATFTDVYGSIDSPVAEYFTKAAIALVLALPNLLGIRIVGRGMAVMSIFVMIPFAVLFVWGVIRAKDWGAVGKVRRSDVVYDENGDFISMSGGIDINWSLLINTLFWNFNGAVGMSVFGGEVANPGYTYPRALLISVLLVALTYLAPLFGATVFNSPHWTTWEEGSFSGIAEDIGGGFLSNWVVLATFCSNAGMYIAELFCDSFQILGMAECGLAPAFLKARNKRFNTPHNAVFASLVIILVLIKFEFDEILGMTNALSAFYQLLILLAFIKLRFSQPETERPFKVPGNTAVLILALLIPTGLLVYIAVDVFFTLIPAVLVVGMTLAGLLYARWRKFTRAQFRQLATNSES
ncbi:Serine/threonine exchanger SteT [Phytophthora cinnamomi]|uniref:Serine/threonine exchanger SteT n=1 Tax=Phytophthora cinnamomi TaxID=4785 RepID=UPI00355A1367|nr:Serine/threonine exchanger SteT [Phytophthora cinnamomi]